MLRVKEASFARNVFYCTVSGIPFVAFNATAATSAHLRANARLYSPKLSGSSPSPNFESSARKYV